MDIKMFQHLQGLKYTHMYIHVLVVISFFLLLSLCEKSFNCTTKTDQVIHSEGIIHNDLKPENFVCIRGRLKLIDFGIANRIEEEYTSIERDVRCGTMNYMAPETIETHADQNFFKVQCKRKFY